MENVFFTRALATSHIMDRTRNYKDVIRLGSIMMLLSAISTIFIWFIRDAGLLEGVRAYYRPFVYIICISVVYVVVCLVMKKLKPDFFKEIGGLLPAVSYSGAVFGIQVIAANEYPGLFGSLLYSIGASAGVLAAFFIVNAARERLLISKVPRVFQGAPVLLIYIGILSLAIFGLIGHRLAS